MPLNSYFSSLGENFSNENEQTLIKDLVQESIQIMGVNMYYMRRTEVDTDSLYGEDDLAQFNSAALIPMYIENVEGWEGDERLLTDYGIVFRDQAKMRVSINEFEEILGAGEKPDEGDLVYMPLSKNLFSITKVSSDNQFFPTGIAPSFVLSIEEFVYSQEDFNTGVAEIDDVLDDEFQAGTEPTAPEVGTNDDFQTEGDTLIDFSESSPFGSY